MVSSSDVRVEVTTPAALDPADRQEWDELFSAQAGVANPFCAPEWVEVWYSTFTRPADQVLLTVREGARLIGVAPFFRNVGRRGPARLASRLLAGAGQGGSLLELPQILTAAGKDRVVLRSVVGEILANPDLTTGTGWAEITIGRSQGWFEPDWLAGSGHSVAFFRQHPSRASVVVPLAGSWETTRTGLKRNIKESLRRSRNRLAKQGRPWAVRRWSEDLDVPVVDRFLKLHRERAAQEVAARHPDAYADPVRRQFLREVLPRLGLRGRATILELVLGEDVVASQLVLHAPELTYIHSSGFVAEVWDLGPATFLQGDAIAAAADRGERWINMSPGPNAAKLRWSEQFDVHDDFAFGCGSRPLKARYTAFAAGQAMAQVRHAIAMFAHQSER